MKVKVLVELFRFRTTQFCYFVKFKTAVKYQSQKGLCRFAHQGFLTFDDISPLSICFKKKKKVNAGVPIVAQQKRIRLVSMRMRVPSLALLSGLRIQHCWELWCKSQTRLRPGIAVAVV